MIENTKEYWNTKKNLTTNTEIITEFEEHQGLCHNTMKWLLKLVPKAGLTVDAGCFPKGTKIINENLEEIPIEKIQKNNKVLTHKGNIKKVIRVFKRHTKKLITIKSPYGFKLTATEEHPILSIKKENVKCYKSRTCNTLNKGKCVRCGKQKYNNASFIPICKLQVGDFIAIPRKIKTYKKLKIQLNNATQKELAYFLGWYLAEGNLIYSHNPKICGVGLTLNINRKKEAKELRNIALKLGCKSVSIKERKQRHTLVVSCYGKKIAELIFQLGGRYSYFKKLHPCIFNWVEEEHKALLKGYFGGDAHQRYMKNGGEQYTVKTASYELYKDVKFILNRYGICPGFGKDQHYFSLTLSGEDCSFFLKRMKKYVSHKRYRLNDDYIFIPIIKKYQRKTDVEVYNLKVEDDNSYIANGICVHNCGDGRYVTYLLNQGYESVEGFDFAKKRVNAGISAGLKLKVGNVLDAPYFDKSFNNVISIGVLHHLETTQHDRFFIEHSRLLKKGGTLFVATPVPNAKRKIVGVFKEQIFVNYPKRAELRNLFLKHDFEILKISEDNYNLIIAGVKKE